MTASPGDTMPPGGTVAYYPERLRRYDDEDAWFYFLEMESDIFDELVAAFRAETYAAVRTEIVEVIWERRNPKAIPFHGEVLQDSDPALWRAALDGLVAFRSPAALEILQTARAGATGQRGDWIAESIQRVADPTYPWPADAARPGTRVAKAEGKYHESPGKATNHR